MNKNKLVQSIKAMRLTADDQTAARALDLYPMWGADLTVSAGDRYQYEGKLYKCVQSHTTQPDWTPDVTPAMWTVIDVEHMGTVDDPIPWAVNMECYKDKYYTWDNVLYKCIRDSGIALAYTPDQLIGDYFEVV